MDTGLVLPGGSTSTAAVQRNADNAANTNQLVITKHATDNRTYLTPLSSLPVEAQRDPVQYSISTIMSIFSNTRAHPDRFIYALAGTIFKPESPFPFGGPRLSPGYTKFEGDNCQSLLHFIVAGTYDCYHRYRDRKVMDLVCASIGRVLAMHYQGMKDALDERVLKGMKKSGHIEWFGAANIPDDLQHVKEIRGRDATAAVEFFARKRSKPDIQDSKMR
ncbi:hypothetical protein BC830DRAFT_1140758 [Chytriomyces sp. MP71]|nr:hypothetical protein BC830DRAFT_1140758 [Chytriomyces sp. MP71]